MSDPQPEPPRNVVAVMPDGRRIPLDLVYEGRAPDGLHVWATVAPIPGHPQSVSIDELPAHTTLMLEVAGA